VAIHRKSHWHGSARSSVTCEFSGLILPYHGQHKRSQPC
jgi:hypothetical protein